ncbi:Stk1 family PASTA domain-containing Ser/Thr kinase [Ruania zhangjianzhongii]|uniref:Stk1 family PASTA domain-containing Ser/Thr kinase n=1 Tax=Ruania zhangjianzhongii TaxID=2603206 RepID=UPI001F2972A2|nr:Stk1 family PASTA domain-containing Ser/Thr kinase [Ruania zhangjianzhongii]
MVNDVPRVLSGRYEIGEPIGRGGMAEVYIGRDNRLGRTVAIKMLRSDLARDPSFHARFRREAQSAASLNHPAIVSVYDTGDEATTGVDGAEVAIPFIVMEYVEGHTVRDLLKDGSALPLDEAVEITQGVLAALEYSHHAGIVHRDIKPANVMLTPTGAVKVMDFGIARAMADSSATMTQTQAVVGTAQYLSPEQARGEVVDTRSDLYSTGCLLYELLTGQPPFSGDSAVAVAYQHVSEHPKPPSEVAGDVPEPLDRIVMKALAKDRDARYATAAEFRADLDAAISDGVVQAPSLAAAAAAAPATQVLGAAGTAPPDVFPSRRETLGDATDEDKPKRSKALVWVLAIVAVLAAAAIAILLINRPEPPPPPPAQVAVPDLAGMTQDEARAALLEVVPEGGSEGLELVVGDPVADPDVPEDQAVSWTPETETMVDEGSSVEVVFSSGPGELELPDVSGMSQDQARQRLESEGFNPAGFSVATEDVPNVAQDDVIRTEPEAGTMAHPDDPIEIVIATGNVELPDLVDRDLEEVRNILNDLGLSSSITEQEDEGQAGRVLNQNPGASTVPNNTTVDLVVSIPVPEPTDEPSESPSDDPSGDAESPSDDASGDTESPSDDAGADASGEADASGNNNDQTDAGADSNGNNGG